MRKIISLSIVTLLSLVLISSLAVASTDNIEGALRSLVEENFATAEAEDLEAHMDTMHAGSPVYRQTRKIAKQLFENYELDYELVSFRYVGKNGKYRMARVKQKTINTGDTAYRDNVTNQLWAFRKNGEAWKGWNTMVLEREFLNN